MDYLTPDESSEGPGDYVDPTNIEDPQTEEEKCLVRCRVQTSPAICMKNNEFFGKECIAKCQNRYVPENVVRRFKI